MREDWINYVLENAEHIVPANADTMLKNKILQRISAETKIAGKVVRMPVVYKIAAMVLVLIGLNVCTWTLLPNKDAGISGNEQARALAKDYSLTHESYYY